MNVLYITYCSAEKDEASQLMPAIKRYLSPRIHAICALAKKDNADFRILSGKYGLLSENEEIPFYDHLLMPLEARPVSKLVAAHLEAMDVQKVVFFMEPLNYDPDVAPYLICISLAANEANLLLEKRIGDWG